MNVATAVAIDEGDIAVTFVLVIEDFVEPHQPRRIAARDQRQVEFTFADAQDAG
jgi:hypothetical protein